MMKINRILLTAIVAVLSIGTMSAQDVDNYCTEDVTLEMLTAYMDTVHTRDARVNVFYANLVNNPTHSYRIEHLDLGFNGCTGRVDEQVVLTDGKKRDNTFIFNDKGLLVQSSIQGSKGNKTVVDYTYSFSPVHGYSLKQSKSKNRTTKYAPLFAEDGRRVTIKGDDGSRQDYTYNDRGQLAKLVMIPAKGDKRTLIYQDGYVIREERGTQVFRYHYDFDSIKELKGSDVIHERTFDYEIDTHGRYTRVAVALDGKPQMTITRSYTP